MVWRHLQRVVVVEERRAARRRRSVWSVFVPRTTRRFWMRWSSPVSGVMICGVTPVVKRFHPGYIKCRAHLKYRCGLIIACVINAGIRAASAISAESKGLPRDAGTTAKDVRCGKPFSRNAGKGRGEGSGEKALFTSGAVHRLADAAYRRWF